MTFASSTAGVCSVSGSTASFIAAGSCTINASQAGNSTYAAATTVSRSFTVSATPPSTYQITGQVVLGSAPLSTSLLQNLILTLSNGQSTKPSADGSYSFTVSATGNYTITASYAGSPAVYALSAPKTVTVSSSSAVYPSNNFTATFVSGGSLSPSSPSKEYIFLNGSVIAVEHPH